MTLREVVAAQLSPPLGAVTVIEGSAARTPSTSWPDTNMLERHTPNTPASVMAITGLE